MQTRRSILGATVIALLFAPAARAQQTHVISARALDQAVQQRVAQEQADRDAIRGVLQNPAVRNVAARAGLPMEKAEAAVSTLQGDELHRAANQARQVDAELAGGSDTLVLSTTTLIIIILLVILLIVALK
jgi:hypothetical protein